MRVTGTEISIICSKNGHSEVRLGSACGPFTSLKIQFWFMLCELVFPHERLVSQALGAPYACALSLSSIAVVSFVEDETVARYETIPSLMTWALSVFVVFASVPGWNEAHAGSCPKACYSQYNKCRIVSKGAPSCDGDLTRCLRGCESPDNRRSERLAPILNDFTERFSDKR